jgi:rSAM/selenodomain-associated transferase 2
VLISIIIPTLNEENTIGKLLNFLEKHPKKHLFEVIVVDGGSTDETVQLLKDSKFKFFQTTTASRAHQMNEGAKNAIGDILYFVHSDVELITSFVDDISESIKSGYSCGCYRFKFNQPKNPLLHINGFFTRFPFQWCRGGDQTLYITKHYFNELGGFNEAFVIMEDYELLDRLKEPLKIIPKSVKVSARKYEKNSYMKVQLTNMKAMKMYRKGVEPASIREFYLSSLR